MSLRKAIEGIARLKEKGALREYAIAGAVAALNYIQPTLTEDLDVLVSVEHLEQRPSGLVLLAPIEKALAELGYAERSPLGIIVEGWPVQFLPVGSELDQEALDKAVELDIDTAQHPPLRARCLRAEHLVAIAIKVGRLKDFARVQAFLEQDALDKAALKDVLTRHGLMGDWRAFCAKAGIEDPLRAT
jgi:hypothetical protein